MKEFKIFKDMLKEYNVPDEITKEYEKVEKVVKHLMTQLRDKVKEVNRLKNIFSEYCENWEDYMEEIK